ncbi:flagellar basal body P-ring formation chaperone FlgA [Neoroseomonas oryzicola]|uniref:Flagellar basal body P-ring formation protein FlgA n=1 Tax=Neoroseomonas oryzicola TaxID=535904 RepID=A0A9X9WQH3_9PROT|nr:flagellar basal body P-ring formation chaperone FlgA [Neoroseomonas oryzicola]MBR0662583.1 flagellar basal body P-ring formation protein FlgA [Neoroseomonas oryzicola]NKE15908.1 flagellar basal body P-ring formation protein FlgA [Neoroseomonas oryzicola]
MRRRSILALAGLALPARAQGLPPAPRPVVMAEEATLRLGDIFENAGRLEGLAIGAAPPPGRRMVLDASNLAAIARRHGLAWRPLSGEERSIVERPGRPVPREEVEALLRAEIARLGADAEAELELPGFAPPVVPVAALPEIAIETPSFDGATRRFAATLAVAAEGMATQRTRITGRAVPTVPVVLAVRRIAVGEVVRPGDVEERRLRAERVRPGAAQRAEEVIGKQVRRPIGADLPFMLVDLVAATVVAKNQPVVMVLEAPGIALTAQGRALDAAALGERLPVMNLMSRSVVEAIAIGPGRVRVTPGVMPMATARRG